MTIDFFDPQMTSFSLSLEVPILHLPGTFKVGWYLVCSLQLSYWPGKPSFFKWHTMGQCSTYIWWSTQPGKELLLLGLVLELSRCKRSYTFFRLKFAMTLLCRRVYVQMQPLLIYFRITLQLAYPKLMNASKCVHQRGPLKILLINNLILKIMQSSKVN